jgi:hypothetical protein
MAVGYNLGDAILYIKSPLDTCANGFNPKGRSVIGAKYVTMSFSASPRNISNAV